MDRISKADRSANMRAIRSKGTKPEMLVRRLVHGMGFRYRLHRADLPGIPDLVFAGQRKIIFVHGCFWHQHAGCKRSNVPKSRGAYWLPKLARNVMRDLDSVRQLNSRGWQVLVIWECQAADGDQTRNLIRSFLAASADNSGSDGL